MRDYSLLGNDGKLAVERGLSQVEWYRSPVARKRMKELMRRRNGPAIRDTILWIGLMVATAGIATVLFPSWWSVPFFLVYGVLY